MADQISIQKIIEQINTGTKYPAAQLVKSDPELAALVSKLIRPRDPGDFNINKKSSYHNLNQSQIKAISDRVKSRIKDNENILQLFPDIEMAVQILVSSILSPKDMMNTDLIYKVKETLLPNELATKLNSEIQKHLESHYGIKDELPELLRDTLFEKGSYIKAVLPESIVDELINSDATTVNYSQESLKELFTKKGDSVQLGILGSPEDTPPIKLGASMERFNSIPTSSNVPGGLTYKNNKGYKQIDYVEITDNFKLLKLPFLKDISNKRKLKSILGSNLKVSTEAALDHNNKMTSNQLSGMIYKDNRGPTETFMILPTSKSAKRRSIGRPLVLTLPSESVIPIYIPGNESKHIGYFVLTDIDGNPVSVNSNMDYVDGLNSFMNNQSQNQSLSSLLISKAKRNLTESSNEPTVDQVTKIYTSIVESDLINRLKNGIYGENVAIGGNEEIYRIMLARSLSAKYTRLIFVPGELITYFAFKYFNNGVGKSYLDDIKVLSSLRAILLFSKVMATTKASISLTHVNMTIDPNDPDPAKTVEMSTHEIMKMRQQYFPLGINSPVDLMDWIQRAGFEFTFEGHPGIPQTKFDFETKNVQHIIPDSDLDELLRKQSYMSFGLSPELMDNSFSPEFATTVLSNNILLSKRVLQLQTVLTRLLTDYVQKLVANDSVIFDDMVEVLRTNKGLLEKGLKDEDKDDYEKDQELYFRKVIEDHLLNMEIDLPKPDVTTVETQSEAFKAYSESLDTCLESWITEDMITSELVGEISGNIGAIKSVMKSYFTRKWMTDNGFMPELNDIVTADEDGRPVVDIYEQNKNHLEGIVRSSVKFLDSLKAIRVAANADLAKMNIEAGVDSGGSDESSSDSTGGNEFGMTDEDTGEDLTGAGEEGTDTEE